MENIRLEIVSGEENLFSGEATFVVIPTEMGEIGVYPKHEPLLGRMRPGVLRIKPVGGGEEISLAVSGGIVEIQPNCITVLSDVAVRSENMDAQRAKEAREEAEKRLTGAKDKRSKESAEAALAIAIAQLKTLDYIRQKERR